MLRPQHPVERDRGTRKIAARAHAHRPERGRHRLFAYLRLSRETDRQTKKARPDEDDSAFDAESRIGPASMPACCGGAATTNFETSDKKKRRCRHGIKAGCRTLQRSCFGSPKRRGEEKEAASPFPTFSDQIRLLQL